MFAGWAGVVRFDFDRLGFSARPYFIVGCIFALTTEVLQFFAENRSFDFADLFADTIGLAVGFFVGEKVLRMLRLIQ